MYHNLLKNVQVIHLKVDGTNFGASAGTTDLTSEAIDTQGYESVLVIPIFGAITSGAVTSFKLQQCDTPGGTYADLAGTSRSVADTDDGKIALKELYRPRERYIKVVIDRGTQNAVVDGVIVLLSRPTVTAPITQGATVIAADVHNSPAEGTA